MAERCTGLMQALSERLGADNVRADERVARYTTWRVGGPAALLCVVHDARALARTVELVRDTSRPWLVLGRGSNVLVDDAGLDGVVIVNRAAGLAIGTAEGDRRQATGDRKQEAVISRLASRVSHLASPTLGAPAAASPKHRWAVRDWLNARARPWLWRPGCQPGS